MPQHGCGFNLSLSRPKSFKIKQIIIDQLLARELVLPGCFCLLCDPLFMSFVRKISARPNAALVASSWAKAVDEMAEIFMKTC